MSRRLWRDLISAVVVFVVLPPVLLWWALTAGLIWPFNDNYYDPHTEISKSYHRHPDAFHDAAYHLLAQAQQHPNALRAQSGASYGQATWYLDTVDAKTGEQTTKKTVFGRTPRFVDISGVPGGRSLHAAWFHTHPKCVFFYYEPNTRDDRERIDVLKKRGTIVPPTSVALVYHPSGKPPRRFVNEGQLDVADHNRLLKARKENPLFLGLSRNWRGQSINSRWSVMYS